MLGSETVTFQAQPYDLLPLLDFCYNRHNIALRFVEIEGSPTAQYPTNDCAYMLNRSVVEERQAWAIAVEQHLEHAFFQNVGSGTDILLVLAGIKEGTDLTDYITFSRSTNHELNSIIRDLLGTSIGKWVQVYIVKKCGTFTASR